MMHACYTRIFGGAYIPSPTPPPPCLSSTSSRRTQSPRMPHTATLGCGAAAACIASKPRIVAGMPLDSLGFCRAWKARLQAALGCCRLNPKRWRAWQAAQRGWAAGTGLRKDTSRLLVAQSSTCKTKHIRTQTSNGAMRSALPTSGSSLGAAGGRWAAAARVQPQRAQHALLAPCAPARLAPVGCGWHPQRGWAQAPTCCLHCSGCSGCPDSQAPPSTPAAAHHRCRQPGCDCRPPAAPGGDPTKAARRVPAAALGRSARCHRRQGLARCCRRCCACCAACPA